MQNKSFMIDDESANGVRLYRQVDWDWVVSQAIRVKLKMLRQTSEPRTSGKRPAVAYESSASPGTMTGRPTSRKAAAKPREKPAMPTAEQVVDRLAMLRGLREGSSLPASVPMKG